MKHEFSNTAPILRLVFAVAALSVSLSIGGWIDFLATGYATAADTQQRTVLTAQRKQTSLKERLSASGGGCNRSMTVSPVSHGIQKQPRQVQSQLLSVYRFVAGNRPASPSVNHVATASLRSGGQLGSVAGS